MTDSWAVRAQDWKSIKGLCKEAQIETSLMGLGVEWLKNLHFIVLIKIKPEFQLLNLLEQTLQSHIIFLFTWIVSNTLQNDSAL